MMTGGTLAVWSKKIRSRLFLSLGTVLLCGIVVYGNLGPRYALFETTGLPEQSPNKNAVTGTSFEEMAIKQGNRIRIFRHNCRRLKCYNESYERQWQFTFASDYKLAWKIVPKIGSTFLLQAFGILNEKKTENVFDERRSEIHIGAKSFLHKKKFDMNTLQNYTVLVMARNPFSRLFSAYIDKVYLPNNIDLSRHIYKRTDEHSGEITCQFKNTFDEFLNYALDDNIERITKVHYNPTVLKTNCDTLCQIPNIVVVKQESFSEDIDYALKLVGVEGKKYNTIHSAMHEKHVQSTIPGIVNTVYQKMKELYSDDNFKKMVSKNCLSWSDIAERMWKSFQIQGYIHDKVGFPHKMFKSGAQYKDVRYLIDVMLEEISKHPLTHEQMVQQRTRAMLTAYAGVSEDTMKKIVDKYSLDFSLYGYSHELPNI